MQIIYRMKRIQNKSSFLSVPFIGFFSIICIPLAYIPLTSIHREHKFPEANIYPYIIRKQMFISY